MICFITFLRLSGSASTKHIPSLFKHTNIWWNRLSYIYLHNIDYMPWPHSIFNVTECNGISKCDKTIRKYALWCHFTLWRHTVRSAVYEVLLYTTLSVFTGDLYVARFASPAEKSLDNDSMLQGHWIFDNGFALSVNTETKRKFTSPKVHQSEGPLVRRPTSPKVH
jgi:hypothetical protein